MSSSCQYCLHFLIATYRSTHSQCSQDWSRSVIRAEPGPGLLNITHTQLILSWLQILGEITHIHPTTEFEGYSFTISKAADILGDCNLGDSIAVNGCCLTVTEWDSKAGWFTVGLSNETLSRTDLGQSWPTLARVACAVLSMLSPLGSLKVGSKVNLERAMSGHGRFGGHFVQVSSVWLVYKPSVETHICRDMLIRRASYYLVHPTAILCAYSFPFPSNFTRH